MKQRLDVLLTERGLTKSREQARALIMAGVVYVGETKAQKAGDMVQEDALLTVRGSTCPFVSRGGLKLQKAMQTFPICLENAVCADIGASTGGFTDCMLQSGAKRVFAVDVGYGQLDWKLRSDGRVVVLEKRNARFMEPDWYGEALDFASIDVSFISLDKILPALLPCLGDGAEVVALIKPQFEAGRDKVGKHGVVSDGKTHIEVCKRIINVACSERYAPLGITYSPIRGPKGNVEFLLWMKKCPPNSDFSCEIDDRKIEETVNSSSELCIS